MTPPVFCVRQEGKGLASERAKKNESSNLLEREKIRDLQPEEEMVAGLKPVETKKDPV